MERTYGLFQTLALDLFDLAGDFNTIHREKLLHMRVGAFLQIRNGSEVDGLAFEQEHNGIGYLPHEIQIMGHNNGSEAELLLQIEHQIAKMIRHDRIDHCGGLVVQNAFRLSG